MAALAGLHSAGKGANKRPPMVPRHPGSVRAKTVAGSLLRPRASLGARALCASAARAGWIETERTRNRDHHVCGGADTPRYLYVATASVGAVGVASTLVPLIAQMNPDASTIAAGAPIEVDLAPIAEGQVIKVFWRGKPIFISHLTKKELEEAQTVPLGDLKTRTPPTSNGSSRCTNSGWS